MCVLGVTFENRQVEIWYLVLFPHLLIGNDADQVIELVFSDLMHIRCGQLDPVVRVESPSEPK